VTLPNSTKNYTEYWICIATS